MLLTIQTLPDRAAFLYIFYIYTNCKTSLCQVPLDLCPDFTNGSSVTSAPCSCFSSLEYTLCYPAALTPLLITKDIWIRLWCTASHLCSEAHFVYSSLFPQIYFLSGFPHLHFFLRLNAFCHSDPSTTPWSGKYGHSMEISSSDGSNCLCLGETCVPQQIQIETKPS